MKKIFLILFLFIGYITFAQGKIGSEGNVIPTGNYPIVNSKDIKGTLHSFKTIIQRNALPNNYRDTGMIAYVSDSLKYYHLVGGIDNINWEELKLSGSGIDSTAFHTLVQPDDSSYLGIKDLKGRVDTIMVIGDGVSGSTGGISQSQLDDTAQAIRSSFYIKSQVDAFLATKQDNITLTTNGYGLATLTGSVLNIPNNSSTVTSFQWSVIDSISTPLADTAVSVGDKFLVGTSPTGAFSSNANKIAVNTGTGTYSFSTATVGDILYNAKSAFVNKWDGTKWERIGRSANIHQFGDSYGQPIQIGSNDNDTLYLRAHNTKSASLVTQSNGGSLVRSGLTVYSQNGGSANAYLGYDAPTGAAKISLYQYGSETYFRGNGELGVRANNYLNLKESVTGGKAFNINNVGYGSTDIFYVDVRGNTTANSFKATSTNTPSVPNPVMTQTQVDAITGNIVTFTFTGGSGYTDGVHTNDPAIGGSGNSARFSTTVSGGIVTACTVQSFPGLLYKVDDVLTISTDSIGTGSGFAITVTGISNSSGNQVFNSTRNQPAFYNGVDWVYPAQYGTATLSSGTITVSDTRVKTSAKILVSCNTPSGTQGFLSAKTSDIVDGTSFIINSSSSADNSTVNYQIVNP